MCVLHFHLDVKLQLAALMSPLLRRKGLFDLFSGAADYTVKHCGCVNIRRTFNPAQDFDG